MTNALKMNEKKSKKYPQIFICGVSSLYKAKSTFTFFKKNSKTFVQISPFCHWED